MLYLLPNLHISSLTEGILRSRCIVSLVAYQGAFIKNLRVSHWNRWRISMLELLAVPHSWTTVTRKSIRYDIAELIFPGIQWKNLEFTKSSYLVA